MSTLSPKGKLRYSKLRTAEYMIVDRKEAIRIHLENERDSVRGLEGSLVFRNTEIHIRAFEQAPRISRLLELTISHTKRKMKRSNNTETSDMLYVELCAYERLLGMVKCAEEGRPLDGLAY